MGRILRKNMIKAVLFDLDNTLIDFMKFKRVSCEAAIDAMMDAGLKLEKDEALKKLYKIYFKEGLEDPLIFQKFLTKVIGDVDYRILAYGIVAYRQARTGFLHPYPHTKKTLLRLKEKGLKLAIISDAPKIKAWIRLVNMNLDDFFDIVVAFEDTGKKKPDKEPFLKALEELNLKPEECLMVGDWPERDLKGAKALGIKTCFAKYGHGDEHEQKPITVKADYVIDEISELVDLV